MCCNRTSSGCGGLSEAVKVYYIAEAAGLVTIPHGGAQQCLRTTLRLCLSRVADGRVLARLAPPGIPLDEVHTIPGTAVPQDGRLVPSDAPGFGMEIEDDWIVPR